MDFYNIAMRPVESGANKGKMEIYPDFKVGRSTDLMVRGGAFYAIWDEKVGLWSTDEYDVVRLVDEDLYAYSDRYLQGAPDAQLIVRSLRSFNSNSWKQFRLFMKNVSDNNTALDNKLTFANSEVRKSDHASKRLPYSLAHGDHSAWDELVGTLYNVEERTKIEWSIGAIVAGDAKKLQKFDVFYGPPGSGKSTILNIIEKLFEGYTTTFDAKALGSSNAAFATEVFKTNPLVAIQHDGDLSKIDDNARLNSIISHEMMPMNEKYKAVYTDRVNAFLLMGTNQPVKISDAKSGIIRRLIDIHPTGVSISTNHYFALMSRIDFELGAIAQHCLDVYQSLGKNHYNAYRATEMMLQTDVFFNFIEAHYDIFKTQDSVTLKQAYTLYKAFCDDTGIERPLPQYKVRSELREYFEEFHDRGEIDGVVVRSLYRGFTASKFKTRTSKEPDAPFALVLEDTVSRFDEEYALQPAQYASVVETPKQKWDTVSTTLADINTQELHFVKVPQHHIVIDFDLKDENGQKSLERNLEAASNWPATYAELSKSGGGVHLHYNYDGDTDVLNPVYSEGIEVKVYRGDSSLRRRLSKCNNTPVATINSGLPIKEKKVISDKTLKTEQGLRRMIERNLAKEFFPSTKQSVEFIKDILNEAHEAGWPYDVTDMKPKIIAFANSASNQALPALKLVAQMKFKSETTTEASPAEEGEKPLVLFDVEVYPNLFVVCWKFRGSGGPETVARMIDPTPAEIEALLRLNLVGFNNRRYDNHILYARYMGASNAELYQISQKIISNDRSATFGEAYNLSYADIWDFASKKQTLKKWEIELGIHHMELNLPWDEPVDDDMIPKVVEYCVNDVMATEATLEACAQDLVARQILSDLSGLPVNSTTQNHTAKIIFGADKRPQEKFVYTELKNEFPGYKFDPYVKVGKSSYKGEDPSEGGYVYAEPGMYENVVVLDVASMHPTSIVNLNLFGEYTPKFKDLLDARVAIKRKNYVAARKMLDGKLAPYLKNEEDADKLSYALKIVINIVYGLTSASFPNPFRDSRNVDNIVAKRGALFMIELKQACQARGLKVVHIKTDSIKIPNATPADIQWITEFGAKYGYEFEHEATYDRFCLVNDAVYIARYGWAAKSKLIGKWDATGAQFQHPYVYKTLFSHEEIEFADLCEAKSVMGSAAMYMDFDHQRPKDAERGTQGMHFVGKTGLFIPVDEANGGGVLYRVAPDKDGVIKLHAVSGTKGHLWMEAENAVKLGDKLSVDMTYFTDLAEAAYKSLAGYGDVETFID